MEPVIQIQSVLDISRRLIIGDFCGGKTVCGQTVLRFTLKPNGKLDRYIHVFLHESLSACDGVAYNKETPLGVLRHWEEIIPAKSQAFRQLGYLYDTLDDDFDKRIDMFTIEKPIFDTSVYTSRIKDVIEEMWLHYAEIMNYAPVASKPVFYSTKLNFVA
jgi:hypothetical protein